MQTVYGRILSACVALLMCCAVRGQELRGALGGAVVDPAGAVIPGTKVVAKEVSMGALVQTASDASGQYNLPFLALGDDDISLQSSGFKEFIRWSVHVGARGITRFESGSGRSSGSLGARRGRKTLNNKERLHSNRLGLPASAE